MGCRERKSVHARRRKVAITRIIVIDFIMAGSLVQEQEYDSEQSADNLADLKGQIIVGYLEEHYPGVEIYADIAIQKECGTPHPLEVMVYVGEEEIDRQESAALRQQLMQRLAEGTAGQSWAVRAK
jgi:hypothetical protein